MPSLITSRTLRRPLLALIALSTVAATACSDDHSPLSPLADGLAAAAPVVHASTLSIAGDTTVQTFTVNPAYAESYDIGGVHRVDLQAGAICDPATTLYGAAEWDKPCTPATRPITFTTKFWTDATGHARVTFSPDVRFVPGKTNTITLKDKDAAAMMAGLDIVWCPTGTTRCVNESLTDSSLDTRLNSNGTLSRRIKHFSGYTVVAD